MTRAVEIGQTLPRKPIGWLALALLAYVPALRTAPGFVAADTKQYLYLDPARLMGRAAYMWDPNVGMGTVTHQTIGYLFPMGPFYWSFDRFGVPDWVAQRLWLGSILFVAAAGVLYLFRTFGIRGPGVVVGALAYMLTPYSLDYAARISVLLLPWAALPWMIALMRKALRDGGWRYPAIFALVVQVVGGVNATALIFAGVGPVLWIAYSWLVAREVQWRRALSVAAKTGLLTIFTSLWWIAGLSIQSGYGLNVLKYTETVEAVALTSTPNEILRGLGYWFFYGQDRLGPWIEASSNYTQRPVVLLAGYALACLSLLAAGVVRWRHRVFFVGLLLVGVVISVGAHPYDDPSPLGAVFKAFANSSTAGLALRSTGRAVPLVVLATAMFLGLGVNAAYDALRRRARPFLAVSSVGIVVALVFVNFPALVDDTFYGKNLQRPEDVPEYWLDAADYLDATDDGTRVFEVPGLDFASYRWGNTVDPITPGLTERPYVARELIPYGGPGTADLLNAVDRRLQEGLFDERGFTAIARRMGVGAVVLRNDIQFERYDVITNRELARAFAEMPGLGSPRAFGAPTAPALAKPHEDELTLRAPVNEPLSSPVVVYAVEDPAPIVRAESDERAVMIAGDGEGLVDVADLGLLDDAGVVQYSASFGDDEKLRDAIADDMLLVVTDSNRRRARKWSSVLDNVGVTEQPGEEALRRDLGDARLDVFPDERPSAQTVVDQQGVRWVAATAYGNVISYTSEDRAARAFDGDAATAWRAGGFGAAIGQRLHVVLDEPITTNAVEVVQPLTGGRDRFITEVQVSFDGGPAETFTLDGSSRTAEGQRLRFDQRRFRTLDIEVSAVNVGKRRWHGGADAVGFAEVRVRDDVSNRTVRVEEVVRMPTDLLGATGADSVDHPLVVVMNRERVVPIPPRTDPEVAIVREFELPTARTFTVTGDARVTSAADHAAIDRALGYPTPEAGGISTDAREFLKGCVACRADAAIDGDAATAWQTPFIGVRGQWAEFIAPDPLTVDHLDLQVIADGRHSVPTRLRVEVDDEVRDVVLPTIEDQAGENSTVAIPIDVAPMTGRRVRVTIVDVREQLTFTLDGASTSLLPAGIAELGIAELTLDAPPRLLSEECRADLLRIDGRPVPVRIVGTGAAAAAMERLTVEPCREEITLGPGRHVVRAASGVDTGVELDRLVFAADGGDQVFTAEDGRVTSGAASAPPTPVVHVADNGRTRISVKVEAATEPFWLVLGQSHSEGWTARVPGGDDLGPPQLVDGYANGWYVTPTATSFDIVLDWTPQRRVWASLWISLGVAILCCVLIALTWRRARTVVTAMPGDADVELGLPGADGIPLPTWARVATVVVAGGVAALVAAPWIGVVAAALTALAVLRPRARVVLALAPPLLLGIAALYIVYGQRRYEFDPIFEWPVLFPWARTLGWLALALLGADAVIETFRTLRPSRPEANDDDRWRPHDE
ncbi:MAG: alpha-(1-_3)-arabinofuranosyltransferase family protein [Actinomycetota bacterium]|nr:alpha-(1->3)-arabinofuranosyltransferase family protein [Actinomycetota bacterium]